jgi:thioredoxin-like negative regulator of GroEL
MKQQSEEATALARVAEAAREVQAASAALEQHFNEAPGSPPSTLQLARFAAAMQELKEARESFDALLGKSSGSLG